MPVKLKIYRLFNWCSRCQTTYCYDKGLKPWDAVLNHYNPTDVKCNSGDQIKLIT